MTENHPIKLNPQIVSFWMAESYKSGEDDPCRQIEHVALQAARWGADIELEECCKLAENDKCCGTAFQRSNLVRNLKQRRRPKPPSLKVQALLAIDVAVADNRLSANVANIVRRALGECK